MTATTIGLDDGPIKFLGAYVKNITSNLGLSVNPSTINITLAEDKDEGVFFERPVNGSFHTISAGDWSFSGIITRYEIDVAQIGGRLIRVNMADPREIMKSAPVIIAPGYSSVIAGLSDTECSIVDVYGAYDFGILNLSGWNQAGMTYQRILSALNGDNIRYGETLLPVPQQFVTVFGETYRFDLSALSSRVDLEYRINTNLVPLSSIIEDISNRHSFDWFVTSSKASDGIIDVVINLIDRSTDNVDIDLREFLLDRVDRVVSATSGIELRNDLACLVMQGAPVEQMTKVDIKGLANEPIDLTPESGSNAYIMTEDEMRVVLASKPSWEFWLSVPVESGGGGGLSRYGGFLEDSFVIPIVDIRTLYQSFQKGKVISNKQRSKLYLGSDRYALAGKIYTKLKGKAESTYGKRWVHDDIANEIISTAWTRDVVADNDDPYEYFRQDDGRTRAFVEFTSEDAGGAFSLGLNNLTNLFGELDTFRNVTRFGRTFSNVTLETGVLELELGSDFDPSDHAFTMDKSNYTYNDTALTNAGGLFPPPKTSLYVAATVDKDGVIKIDAPVFESRPDIYKVLNIIIATSSASILSSIPKIETQSVTLPIVGTIDIPVTLDADQRRVRADRKIRNILRQHFGHQIFGLAARAYEPKYAYIPTRSRTTRYGPVFSSALSESSQGKVEIIQDDGFAPWEFGSVSLMNSAMQLKVDNATSTVRDVFTANIVVEGLPELNLGDSLEKNSNITSLSISFGDGGTKTTYTLQTYTRKFGQFTKEDWARIAMFANGSAARTLPQQQISFVQRHRFGVDKQIPGNGDAGGSTVLGGSDSFG